MPADANDRMAALSAQAFRSAMTLNASAANASAALAAVSARSFADILYQFAEREAVREILVDGLCRFDPGRVRASMDKKVRGWLSGKNRPTAREDLWELCFVLKLDETEADAFLAMAGEAGIHWRDPRELTWAFALRKGMTWPQAAALLGRVFPGEENGSAAPYGDTFTPAVRREAALLDTEEQLARYLKDARSRLGTYHNRAYRQFMAYLALLEKPCSPLAEEESYTVRRIVETYLDNRLPAGWDKRKLDEKRQRILSGWPDEVSLSRMKTGRTDVNRKTMMLLFLATDGGEDLSGDGEEDAEEENDPDADFRSSFMRMNRMLSSCGFCMLDSRNPFDWVAIYCMKAAGSPDAIEGLSERLSRILETLFPADGAETGSKNPVAPVV